MCNVSDVNLEGGPMGFYAMLNPMTTSGWFEHWGFSDWLIDSRSDIYSFERFPKS